MIFHQAAGGGRAPVLWTACQVQQRFKTREKVIWEREFQSKYVKFLLDRKRRAFYNEDKFNCLCFLFYGEQRPGGRLVLGEKPFLFKCIL